MKQVRNDKSGFYAGLLFLVWPLLALISAFRNYKSSWAKNILWAFVAFYGFAFAIGIGNSGSDIVRYVGEVQELHHKGMSIENAVNYYKESQRIDIVRTVIAVTLSLFTVNQAVVTFVFGIIYGFFFSRNMWFVLDRLKGKLHPITILLFACFFLVIPIWNMNGFRMYTAAHVFIYGMLPYLFEGKKRGLLISASSILVHFSFIVPVGVLLGYLLLGNRLVLYFSFFVLTFFISEIDIDIFNQTIENYAPEIVQEETSAYRAEDTVEEFRTKTSTRNWYAVWYRTAMRWSVMGFLVVLFVKGWKFFREHKFWMNLFCFTLLYYGVANLFSSIPSGGRYLTIANMLALALILLYVQNREHEIFMKRFIIVAVPALLLFVIVAFRIGLYSMSATSVLGNPLLALFTAGQNISLNDVMKMIL